MWRPWVRATGERNWDQFPNTILLAVVGDLTTHPTTEWILNIFQSKSLSCFSLANAQQLTHPYILHRTPHPNRFPLRKRKLWFRCGTTLCIFGRNKWIGIETKRKKKKVEMKRKRWTDEHKITTPKPGLRNKFTNRVRIDFVPFSNLPIRSFGQNSIWVKCRTHSRFKLDFQKLILRQHDGIRQSFIFP